jgi:hypothetical protein
MGPGEKEIPLKPVFDAQSGMNSGMKATSDLLA